MLRQGFCTLFPLPLAPMAAIHIEQRKSGIYKQIILILDPHPLFQLSSIAVPGLLGTLILNPIVY